MKCQADEMSAAIFGDGTPPCLDPAHILMDIGFTLCEGCFLALRAIQTCEQPRAED